MNLINPFVVVSLGTIALSIYLLVVAIKDSQLTNEQLFTKSKLLKLVLCAILLSQFGLIILPEYEKSLWLTFNFSVFVLLAYIAKNYYYKIKSSPK